MGLEEEMKENTKAVHRNTNEMGQLRERVNVYIETSERDRAFLQDLVNRLVKHEQELQKRWQAAFIKWGGWIVGVICVLVESYKYVQGVV